MNKNIRVTVACVILSLLAGYGYAFQPEKPASQSVEEGVQAVLTIVRKYAALDAKDTEQAYLREVSEVLEPVIGYPVIARRVMGDAYNHATRAQKLRFLETFKSSMVNTYAGGLFAFGAYEVKVLPSQDDKKDTLRNTRVYMEVISPDGIKYTLVQSVYYSQSSSDWKMQNAIFNGINLGITFKTQFDQIYLDSNRDIDRTIVEWERITAESYQKANFRGQ